MSPPRRHTRNFRRNEDAIIAAIDYRRSHPSHTTWEDVVATHDHHWKLSDCAIIRLVTAAWNYYFPHLTDNRK